MSTLKKFVPNLINERAKKQKEKNAYECQQLRDELEKEIAKKLNKINNIIRDYEADFQQIMADIGIKVIPTVATPNVDLEGFEKGTETTPNASSGGL